MKGGFLMNKPCSKCPWIQTGMPLITDILKQAALNDRFTCHVDLGVCNGAKNFKYKTENKKPHGKDKI